MISPQVKKTLLNLLKLSFSFGIVFMLFKSGRLDFSLVAKSFKNKQGLLICILLLVAQILLATLRWKKLVEIKSEQKLPFFKITGLTWIGLFFSSVLPGVVTGDFVKLVYARHIDKNLSKTFLLTTILMDRIIGLIGLLCLMGIISLFTFNTISSIAPQMIPLLYFNFSLFAGVIVFLISLFLPKKIQSHILNFTARLPLLGKHINKTLEQVWLIGENKKTVMSCFFISIITQTFSVLAFWEITAPFYNVDLPFIHAFTFMPVGFMAMAIPITPAGLGVGHAIFESLFSFFHVKNGASLFNIYFINYIAVNILGIIPYMLNSSRPTEKEIQEFS